MALRGKARSKTRARASQRCVRWQQLGIPTKHNLSVRYGYKTPDIAKEIKRYGMDDKIEVPTGVNTMRAEARGT